MSSIRRSPAHRLLSIGLLALLGAGVACKARDKAPVPPPQAPADTTPAEPAAPEPAPPAPVVAAPIEVRPSCDQFQLTENGAAAVRIGDARDSLRTRCPILGDSTAADVEGNIQGTVVVGVGGSTMVAQIAADRVNGIFVTDPRFRTMDGLGPGILLGSLMQMPGALALEGVNDLSIIVNAHCGLYFQIPKPPVPEDGKRWTSVAAEMPAGTSIERVVVRGCR